jgi:hypothetical protein
MKSGHQVPEFGKFFRPPLQERTKGPSPLQKLLSPLGRPRGALDLKQIFRSQTSSLCPGLDQERPYLLDSFQRDFPLLFQEIGCFGDLPELIFNFLFSRRRPQGKTKGLPYLRGSVGLQALQEKMKF